MSLLDRHRAAALRALRRDLRSAAYRDAWRSYRGFLRGDLGPARDRPDAKRPIAEVAGRQLVVEPGELRLRVEARGDGERLFR